jgi:hypothetical protein
MSDAERQRRRRAKLDTETGGLSGLHRTVKASSVELTEARKEIERLKAELARERAKKGRNRK